MYQALALYGLDQLAVLSGASRLFHFLLAPFLLRMVVPRPQARDLLALLDQVRETPLVDYEIEE